MIDFKQLIFDSIKKLSGFISRNLTKKTETIILWLTIGLMIRFLIMPILASGDFMTTLWISSTLEKDGMLIHSSDPPAVYFLLSSFYRLMMPLFPAGFFDFLTSGISLTPSTFQLYALLQPGINGALFLSKIPFLIFDILSAFLFLHLFSDKTKGLTAFKIWMINPVVIAVSYAYGQFDIFVVFFMVLSLFFLKRQKFSFAIMALSFGAVFKIVTFAFLPLIILSYWKTMNKKAILPKLVKLGSVILVGCLPLLLLPITLDGAPQYYESVNFAQPTGSWFNGFYGTTFYTRGVEGEPFSSAIMTFLIDYSIVIRTNSLLQDFVYFIPFIYLIVLLSALYERELPFEKTCKYFTVFLLAYYAFSLFHVQWFFWIQPFLILLIVENRKAFGKLFAMLIPLFFLFTLHWDADTTTRLLTPIFPEALYWPGPISLINSIGVPALPLINLFRTLFSALCVFMIIYIVKTSLWIREQKQNDSKFEIKKNSISSKNYALKSKESGYENNGCFE